MATTSSQLEFDEKSPIEFLRGFFIDCLFYSAFATVPVSLSTMLEFLGSLVITVIVLLWRPVKPRVLNEADSELFCPALITVI